MTGLRRTILALAALPVAGCQTTFDLVGVETPLSAQESRNFDGSYQGDIQQTAHNGPGCPIESGERVIMVGDGVLWYAYTPSTLFTVPIRYDGTLSGKSGDAVLDGRILGNHLEMTIQSPSCETALSMQYIYNHS